MTRVICNFLQNFNKKPTYYSFESEFSPFSADEFSPSAESSSFSSSSSLGVQATVTSSSPSDTRMTLTPFEGLANVLICETGIRIIMPSEEIKITSSLSSTTAIAATSP